MSKWSQWAADALARMDETGVENAEAKRALEWHVKNGQEPYYTLKAFVHRLSEEADDGE